MNAALPAASMENEMNTFTVKSSGSTIVFKQIAGLIARRIVCYVKPGDHVEAGQRVGLIKFGSRCDVIFGPEWNLEVTPGMRVSAGSSVLARRIETDQPGMTDETATPSEVRRGGTNRIRKSIAGPKRPTRCRRCSPRAISFSATSPFCGRSKDRYWWRAIQPTPRSTSRRQPSASESGCCSTASTGGLRA